MTPSEAVVLIVDDDRMFRRIVSAGLTEAAVCRVEEEDGRGDILARVRATGADVVLLDLHLERRSGLDVLAQIVAARLDVHVIMLTGTDDVGTAVQAMRAGAFDYVTKPVELDELRLAVQRAAAARRLARERDLYRDRLDRRYSYVESVNPQMIRIYDLARRVAESETTAVLIQGESGTGKEHVANLIHRNSPRAAKPFLEVNCASLPENLLESELFGHEKGAFTDASERKRGLLELADGGTLFLDEIGEMALGIQAKLLRVLERMSFRRVGGTKDIEVSVRIISATNRDLTRAVESGALREDLYFRLKVVPIHLPPLRQRTEDLPVLVEHFLREFSAQFGRAFQRVTDSALAAIRAYPWPGNIRELRNCMERAVLLNEGEALTTEMLQIAVDGDAGPEGPLEILRDLREIGDRGIPEDGIDFEKLVGSLERFLISRAAEKAHGNQSLAARYLHLNRDKLRTRMKNHRLGRSSGA